MSNQCKICDNSLNNEIIIAREMMYGTRDNFIYFKCSFCGCLQISEPPENVSKYYPSGSYYSFQQAQNRVLIVKILKNMIKYFLVNAFLYKVCPTKRMPYIRTYHGWLELLRQLKKKSAILDVGCGAGHLLHEMNIWGYKNLTGIDPFIESNLTTHNIGRGINIFKQDIYNHTSTYDLIMLHHSFEHMDNPHLVFKRLYEMLNPQGLLLIRVPVCDSFAWRKYGNNWFQIDAPRHYFLYTTRSMVHLGKDAGFVLKQVVYDSTETQFLESEKYRRDISLFENLKFPSKYIKSCKKQARILNQTLDGDQACFVFQRKE